MKNLRLIFVILISQIFTYCHKSIIIDETPIIDKAILNFSVYYENPNQSSKYLPDIGTKVYIFNNISQTETTLYKFHKGNLIHYNERDTIFPTKVEQIKDNGNYILIPKRDISKILIFFVSSFYEEHGLKATFSDNLLDYHQYSQDINIFFNYPDILNSSSKN